MSRPPLNSGVEDEKRRMSELDQERLSASTIQTVLAIFMRQVVDLANTRLSHSRVDQTKYWRLA